MRGELSPEHCHHGSFEENNRPLRKRRVKLSLRYKCLILDHDDTAVNSTPTIHYPAFRETLRELRPGLDISLETWMEKNYSPGFLTFVTDELGFSEDELEREMAIWRSYTSRLTAPFFDGFLSLLRRFKKAGGIITVVSHSEKPAIERDYRSAGAPDLPQLIFGWQGDPEKQKPHPFPVNQILTTLGLDNREALILDDLYPAVAMGRAAGVDVAGAGWGHDIPMIRKAMVRETIQYFTTIGDFETWLFMEETL